MNNQPDTPDAKLPESGNTLPGPKKDHCPDCSPGDFICKCCGISVATDEWGEDDQMCSGCSSLLDKAEKKA